MKSSGAATREERDAPTGHDRRILGIVVELLETEGYEAVQLREVARRARTSLATIYKHYANRDELILAALQMWLDENRYAGLAGQSRADGESFYDGQMRVLRTIFEPWEQHPAMLKAYFRARAAPGGEQLVQRGLDAVIPAFGEVLVDVDEAFVADLTTIVTNVVYGLLGRFAAGEIAITDIVPGLERTVYWLSHGYEAAQR
ncbi:TetR family transcriptional regulator [Mycolicibacterium chitae]|uniref:TetR family transcriptional regulator n=1 Tax=Mycolicibacterium chitae TaxID=1792 RepID=A0A3S4RK71_MYCCI|nr:TetR/AcrR family transcriptional regulator [Mycolicibacterium chitae]MCV7106993.1 TetR/AcrR family transcriptional regulator [Mycolicibacterium chitae]BBZ01213.1 TetR family transcriptional regulator [Mycolicibacterium chitae]VEG50051.1 TetR family transcriptional regulator [Mycolicibacterium chitae]